MKNTEKNHLLMIIGIITGKQELPVAKLADEDSMKNRTVHVTYKSESDTNHKEMTRYKRQRKTQCPLCVTPLPKPSHEESSR